MGMLDQAQADQASKNNTLEINVYHPIIVNLNKVRKHNSKQGVKLAKQLLDQVMLQSGIPFNLQESMARNLEIMEGYLKVLANEKEPQLEAKSEAPPPNKKDQ